MELSERKKEILFAVVENYVTTAEPVGSTQIAKNKEISLSSATIRHVMSELEELGFISRPHSSAGGVPTNHAYRFYVDRLTQFKPLTPKEREEIRDWVLSGSSNMNEILREACRLMSDRSHQPGIALPPSMEERNLKHIQFLPLRENLAMAVLVTSSGIVENKLLETERSFTQAELNQMHNYLNATLSGKTIGQVRHAILTDMKKANELYDDLIRQALILGDQALSTIPRDVHIAGQSQICLEPEFANLERMQQILNTLEEKTTLLKLLDQSLKNPGIKIFIGEEVEAPEVNGLALITSTYSDAEGNRGVLGVIGPTRMNYPAIVPLVEYTSKIVTDILREHRA